MKQRYQVSIEADPKVPIVRMTRDFDATPAQLMRAHTDPKLFARWVGPDGMDTEILGWDATSGGRWRYVARRDGEEFLEIAAAIPIRPETTPYPFDEADRALSDLAADRVNGAAVLHIP